MKYTHNDLKTAMLKVMPELEFPFNNNLVNLTDCLKIAAVKVFIDDCLEIARTGEPWVGHPHENLIIATALNDLRTLGYFCFEVNPLDT